MQAADDEVVAAEGAVRGAARRARRQRQRTGRRGAGAQQNLLLLEEARQRLAQLEVDVEEPATRRRPHPRAVLREQRKKAQVAVDVARRNIDNLQMRAPFDGFVTLRMNMMAFGGVVFSGAVMPEYRVGDAANPGQLIADLIDTSRVEITAKLPEYDRANVARRPERCRSPSMPLPGAELEGTVRSVSGVAVAPDVRTAARAGSTSPSTSPATPHASGRASARRSRSPGRPSTTRCIVPRSAVFEVGGQAVGLRAHAERLRAARGQGRARSPSTAAVVEGLEPDAEVALINPNTSGGRPGRRARPAPRGRAVEGAPRRPVDARAAAAASTTCCCTSCARS